MALTEAQRAALDAGRRKGHELRHRRMELYRLEIRILAELCVYTPPGRGQAQRIVEALERIHGERVVSVWTVRRVLQAA